MSIVAKAREDTAGVTRKHKFLSGHRSDLCVEESKPDSAPPVHEVRMDTIGKRKEKKLQGIAEGGSNAPHLAS